MMPLDGKVAVELIPVPPFADDSRPLTAFELARLSAPKVGSPPLVSIVNTCPVVPGATVLTGLVPLPTSRALLLNVFAPVPPRFTGISPEVMIEAGRLGISDTARLVPNRTRPLVSTNIFV